MRILATLPARGGSKGVPQKNIYPLAGKPLIEYTLDSLKICNTPMTVAVSSDSNQILNVAKQCYCDIITIPRPEQFSGDNSTTEDVIIHALEFLEHYHRLEFDCVLTLQPTSPFRSPETIEAFINAFSTNSTIDAQITLHEDYSDFWIKMQNDSFRRLFPYAPRRRQERKPLYIENSCMYITNTEALKTVKSVLGTSCSGFIISGAETIDINTMEDMEYATFICMNRHKDTHALV